MKQNYGWEEEHTKEDYDNKTTEVNGKLNPIMMKVYSEGSSDGAGMPSVVPSDMPSAEGTEGTEYSSMPSIDEID